MTPLEEVQRLFPNARQSPGGLNILVGPYVRFMRGTAAGWYCDISLNSGDGAPIDGEGGSAKEALSYARERLQDTLERGQELLEELCLKS